MDDVTVFGVSDFGDAEFCISQNEPAGVVDLTAAGGIEGGAVKNERWPRGFDCHADFGVEVVKEGIVIVEAVGHGPVISIGRVRRVIKFSRQLQNL